MSCIVRQRLSLLQSKGWAHARGQTNALSYGSQNQTSLIVWNTAAQFPLFVTAQVNTNTRLRDGQGSHQVYTFYLACIRPRMLTASGKLKGNSLGCLFDFLSFDNSIIIYIRNFYQPIKTHNAQKHGTKELHLNIVPLLMIFDLWVRAILIGDLYLIYYQLASYYICCLSSALS